VFLVPKNIVFCACSTQNDKVKSEPKITAQAAEAVVEATKEQVADAEATNDEAEANVEITATEGADSPQDEPAKAEIEDPDNVRYLRSVHQNSVPPSICSTPRSSDPTKQRAREEAPPRSSAPVKRN
jgi:hypothetical protein